ncbi:hypothetical protein [Candidatus Harpocratesius sp.]
MLKEKCLSLNEIQKFHRTVELSIQIFNRIALNPFEKVTIPKVLYSGLPISWNLTQVYNLLHYFYEKEPFKDNLIVLIDKSMNILDGFIIHIDKFTDEDEKGELKSFLEFEVEFISEFQEKSEFFEKLQTSIKQLKPINQLIKEYFSAKYGYLNVQSIIIPWTLKEDIASLNLPSFNTNILLAISKILRWKGYILEGFNDDPANIQYYIISQNIHNKSHLKTLKKWIQSWNNVDIQQWLIIVTTLLDDLLMNMILISEDHQKILFGVKLMVDHNRMKIAALPNHLFKEVLKPELSLLDIGRKVYERTGLRTAVLDMKNFKLHFNRFRESDMGMFAFFSNLFEIVFSATFYPDSLINSFLKLFGLELGTGITEFSNAFKTVTRYFKKILIVTFQDNIEDETKPYEALVEMSYDEGKYSMKLLNTADYQELFRKSPTDKFTRLKAIKEGIETTLQTHYSGCFGFNIDLLSEYLSMKNIQAFLKMSDMAHQLPFIATLGALFVGMKGMKADENGNPIIQTYEESPSDEFISDTMHFQNYIDGFLKKGILFISDEDKSMNRIRAKEYAEQGYLGIDMDALRKFIKESE